MKDGRILCERSKVLGVLLLCEERGLYSTCTLKIQKQDEIKTQRIDKSE